ncbi:MAG TPA: hypothetical protein ENI76_08275 [Ignavibacteria bacterium]|nr:hypothetical protein [Ignavibacteria bacterium]
MIKLTEIILDLDGSKSWCVNGILHREDGPAKEHANGNRLWLINGMFHREDGPAIEHTNGEKSWYLNDRKIEYDPETWDQKVNESRIRNIMSE